MVTDISPADRQRRRERVRRRRLAGDPGMVLGRRLIAAPWETVHREPV